MLLVQLVLRVLLVQPVQPVLLGQLVQPELLEQALLLIPQCVEELEEAKAAPSAPQALVVAGYSLLTLTMNSRPLTI